MSTFKEFLKEKEEEVMNQESDDVKAKVIAMFTEGEPVTVETITAKAEEYEMEKEELEAEVYSVLFDMLNAEEDEEDVPAEGEEDVGGEMDNEEEQVA